MSYLLVRGPAGMTVDPGTGLVKWSPTVASPAQAPVVLQVYDTHGSHATLSFTIDVAAVDLPPVIPPLPLQQDGQEGQSFQLALGASDPQGLPFISWADNLPPGAVYDSASETLSWLPEDGQAGTYPDIQFFVSDGVNEVSATTTLLVAPRSTRRPWSSPPTGPSSKASRSHIPLQASDPDAAPAHLLQHDAPRRRLPRPQHRRLRLDSGLRPARGLLDPVHRQRRVDVGDADHDIHGPER